MSGPPYVVRVAHTSQVSAGTLAAARRLLFEVFDDMTEPDWEHALGGLHAVTWAGGSVVGHASLVQRRLVHGGRALRTGYVEGVAVHADHRRRGCAAAMMDVLETAARGAYELAALGATDEAVPLYVGRGWQAWQGRLSALTPTGPQSTPDEEGAVYVLPLSAPVDLTAELTADWRDGDVW